MTVNATLATLAPSAISPTPTTPDTPASATEPAPLPSNPWLPLSALASFFIGFPMRRARKDTAHKVWLIEPHDLADGQLKPQLARAVIANLPPQQVLQAGDIVLHRTGQRHVPVLLDAPAPDTVAAAPLWVIRPHDVAQLHPPYLLWYLQTRYAQRALAQMLGQAEAAACTRAGLDTLHLYLPPPAGQRALVTVAAELAAGAHKAYELWQQMLAHNERYGLALAQMTGVAGWVVLAEGGATAAPG